MRPLWHGDGIRAAEGAGSFARFAGLVTAALDVSGRLLCALCLAGLFAALLANVILRYTAGSGIGWAYEIHAVLLPWLVGGGIVAAAASGRHIAITLLHDTLGGGLARWLLVAVQLAIIAIAASVLWTSQPILTAAQFQRIPSLGITQYWGYLSLVYAFSGMAVIAALDAVRLVVGEGFDRGETAGGSLS